MAVVSAASNLDSLRVAATAARLARVLEQRLRAYEREDGLGMAELGVLAEIGRGTALPSAIARVAFLDPARVTRIVDRLVQLDLVRRGENARDRRQSPLALTPRGMDRLEQGRADVRAVMDTILDRLTAHEREALTVALDGIRRVLAAGETT